MASEQLQINLHELSDIQRCRIPSSNNKREQEAKKTLCLSYPQDLSFPEKELLRTMTADHHYIVLNEVAAADRNNKQTNLHPKRAKIHLAIVCFFIALLFSAAAITMSYVCYSLLIQPRHPLVEDAATNCPGALFTTTAHVAQNRSIIASHIDPPAVFSPFKYHWLRKELFLPCLLISLVTFPMAVLAVLTIDDYMFPSGLGTSLQQGMNRVVLIGKFLKACKVISDFLARWFSDE